MDQHSDQDAAILVVCTPSTGHVVPMVQIASHLVRRGYDVWFVTGAQFEAQVTRAGVRFVPALRAWNFDGVAGLYRSLVADEGDGDGAGAGAFRDERMMAWVNALYKEVWVRNIAPSLESIRAGMRAVRAAVGPRRAVVLAVETWAPGIIPLKLGAELPAGYDRMPRTLGVSVIPPQIATLEQGPMVQGSVNADLAGCLGLPPAGDDDADAGRTSAALRARNAFLARVCCGALAPTWDAMRFALRSCGASDDYRPLLGAGLECAQIPSNLSFLGHDTTLQMCIPSLEYRATWPAHVRFGGTLPPKRALDDDDDDDDDDEALPAWYAELRRAKSARGRKVVFVTQGTVAVDYTMCVVPTLRAMAGRDDVTVVATLGRRGATLDRFFGADDGGGVPANAVVVDYFPYDPLLRIADVVATNGSYGIFSQCAAYGVPMVVAGAKSEDKPEICNRVAYAGLGVFVQASWPSPEAVAAGINEVLAEGSRYQARAAELRREVEAFGCLETVERELRSLF